MDAELIELTGRLTALVRAQGGDPHAIVSGVEALPGHAGVSYRFTCEGDGAGEARAVPLVLRLAAADAPAVGPNDVVRQARIMAAIGGTATPSGVAVPPIRWYSADPRWFGRPFFVAGFVTGDKPALGGRRFTADEMQRCSAEVVATAAALHRLDWRAYGGAFGEPVGLARELDRLDRLRNRPTLEPQLLVGAAELRARLSDSMPHRVRIGCAHGDVQWSNCLFRGGRLVALIDWELAQTGAVLLDLGWLCMFSDRESWVTDDLLPAVCPAPDELIDQYEAASQAVIDRREIRWFRAMAGYRFGVITAFNLMLHRRGKRHDPMWESIALSGPRLFERGLELLG
ncbi:MAG TPA: phosphotransferase family protein [Candidatus Binataceae bacterium]|nr:phosphotransferase family protein [Candidatus Binataceae bacterium]